jgi:hypothetical protein
MNTKILSLHQKGNLAVVQFSAMPNNTLEMVTSAFALKSPLMAQGLAFAWPTCATAY